jgi:hypothetical protein
MPGPHRFWGCTEKISHNMTCLLLPFYFLAILSAGEPLVLSLFSAVSCYIFAAVAAICSYSTSVRRKERLIVKQKLSTKK